MVEIDHFERLGLPRRFALDQTELERNYLSRSREVHPDHAGESDEVLHQAARLNQAYATLNDDWRRADYLTELLGGPNATAVSQPPPEFLEEMLELRMAIAEAKGESQKTGTMAKTLERRKQEMLQRIGMMLDSGANHKLIEVRQQLNAVKFINGLLRDLKEEQ